MQKSFEFLALFRRQKLELEADPINGFSVDDDLVRVNDSPGQNHRLLRLRMRNFDRHLPPEFQGVVDGQENPIPTIWAKKFFEVQKYVMLTGHMLQSNSIVVNAKFYESLPDDYRKILKEETLAAGEYATELQQGEENSLIANIEKAGTQIIRDVDREAFRKATEGVYGMFKDKWTPGLYQDLRKAIETR